MDMKYLRPIPKYILAKIKKRDMMVYTQPSGLSRFYAYLTVWKGELIKITVAVKNYRKQWYCKQVAVHGTRSDTCFVKDMEYVYFGMGYRVGWYAEGLQKQKRDYETDDWCEAYSYRYYDPYTPIVNLDLIDRLPQFKYSAYKEYRGYDILRYLRIYEKYPQAEYLIKLGLHQYAESIMVLKKIGKDKQFCKWLIRNREKLTRGYYVSTLFRSYKTGEPFDEAQRMEQRLKEFRCDHCNAPIYKLFRGKALEQFFSYIDKQKIPTHLYIDYLYACKYLGIDMSEKKNAFPHDFMRWHDERIEQYRTKKFHDDERERKENAEREAKRQAELFRKFAAIANKYVQLQNCTDDEHYLVLIAKSPAELIDEGNYLSHCVGGMNYKHKFANEETLIFFVRKLSAPEIPFVTLEYSIQKRSVLQCYAHNNTRPDESVLNYVHNKWLPYANTTIQQIAA